jgi:hypothetical protein
MAESLGIDQTNVEIAEIDFEVKSSFTVSGLTPDEWSGNPELTLVFEDNMQKELGHAVKVLGVSASSGSGRRRHLTQDSSSSALEVNFVVQGLKDADSANAVMKNVVDVGDDQGASYSSPSTSSGGGSSSGASLMQALSTTSGRSIQVSQAKAPVIEASVKLDIVAPKDVSAADLAKNVIEAVDKGDVVRGMKDRGVEAEVEVSETTVVRNASPEEVIEASTANAGVNAGAYAAPVVVIAVLGGAAYYYRRRRAKQRDALNTSPDEEVGSPAVGTTTTIDSCCASVHVSASCAREEVKSYTED